MFLYVLILFALFVRYVEKKNQRHLRGNKVNSGKAYLLLHLSRKSNSTLSNMRTFRGHGQFLFQYSNGFAIKGWLVYYTT